MHINEIDLNLLRVFDAVYRTRNVSRAAELLGLTQPNTSQGLTRLRLLVKDALFVRAPGGVASSPRADRLADAVRIALGTIEQAFNESVQFDPLNARKTFRIHMSDIGESRFLPELMAALRTQAPGVQLETSALAAPTVAQALDSGRIDFAFGFLPTVKDTQRVQLLTDRYVVLLRNIARGFAEGGGYTIIEPPFPLRDFTVSLHWSKRFESDPGNQWLRAQITELFTQ